MSETSYITARSATEATAAVRTLAAIIEAKLALTLQGYLVNSCTVQNQSGNDSKISSDSAATHYVLLTAGTTRQLVLAGCKLDIREVYLKVGADNDAHTIEVIFE